MKPIFITMILLFSLFIYSISGQENKSSFLQQFSLEAGSGYHYPFSPAISISTSDYAGFRGFYVGANYAITDLWGTRITYANNTFMDKNDKSNKFTIQKITAEVSFNLLQSINSQQNPFKILAHSGLGISGGKGQKMSDIDKMVNFQIGLMPLYRISKNFNILLDATYVLNIRQNQGYNGLYVNENIKNVVGSYLMLNMGLGINFGF